MIIFFQIANGPKKILEFAIKIVVICWAITRYIMEYLDLGLLRISLNSNGLGSKKFFWMEIPAFLLQNGYCNDAFIM